MRAYKWAFALLLFPFAAACPDFNTTPQPDAGPDGSAPDGQPDAEADAPTDAPPDGDSTPTVPSIGLAMAFGCIQRPQGFQCWGSNTYGELGRGDAGPPNGSSTPAPVVLLDGGSFQPSAFALGDGFACALRDGRPFCWGANTVGQIATDDNLSRSTPAPVLSAASITDATFITAGRSTACVITASKKVFCWGKNENRQLTGDLNVDYVRKATGIPSIEGAKSIALGDEHSCAIDKNEEVVCWGANQYGQAGQTASPDICAPSSPFPMPCVKEPTKVLGLGRVIRLAAGGNYTCALEEGGVVKCWGGGRSGILGPTAVTTPSCGQDGGFKQPCSPTPSVVLDGGAVALSAGENSEGATACVVSNGNALCWGTNQYRELGQGGTDFEDHKTPTPVRDPTNSNLTGVTEITTGREYRCARLADGGVVCWGFDNDKTGVLGRGPAQLSEFATPVEW